MHGIPIGLEQALGMQEQVRHVRETPFGLSDGNNGTKPRVSVRRRTSWASHYLGSAWSPPRSYEVRLLFVAKKAVVLSYDCRNLACRLA